jgi:hypothetical protein
MTDHRKPPFLSFISRDGQARMTTERAHAIAHEEKAARDKKIARLRELRLAQKATTTT